jgi:multicomponent Na+:H+ antiporter subunit E
MKYLTVVLLSYWITLSEGLTAEGLILGFLISLGITYFYKKSNLNTWDKRSIQTKNFKLWIFYVLELLKEVVMSNLHVAKIVLSPNLRISPRVVKLKTGIKSDLNKAIFANSITLTPGTITISLKKNELTIHCLEEESAKGVQDSELEKIIMKAEE